MIINRSCMSQFIVTILNVTSTCRAFQTPQLVYVLFTPLTNSMATFIATNMQVFIYLHYGVFCFKHGCYIVIFIYRLPIKHEYYRLKDS